MEPQSAKLAAKPQSRPRTNFFYPGMGIFAAAVIAFGFARTYYLTEFFGAPSLPLLVHAHGAVMTLWMGLLIAQTTLVEDGRTDVHRRLGAAGGVLAAALTVIGPLVAVHSVQRGHHLPGVDPLRFMAVPLGDIVVFATLVGASLYYRRRPELHKRLMLVATIAILPPGVARWPLHFLPRRPLLFFGIPDLVLLGCIVYDYARTRPEPRVRLGSRVTHRIPSAAAHVLRHLRLDELRALDHWCIGGKIIAINGCRLSSEKAAAAAPRSALGRIKSDYTHSREIYDQTIAPAKTCKAVAHSGWR